MHYAVFHYSDLEKQQKSPTITAAKTQPASPSPKLENASKARELEKEAEACGQSSSAVDARARIDTRGASASDVREDALSLFDSVAHAIPRGVPARNRRPRPRHLDASSPASAIAAHPRHVNKAAAGDAAAYLRTRAMPDRCRPYGPAAVAPAIADRPSPRSAGPH